ncbi:MAG: sulfatase-like hydrolase/transferase, partial [Planctomycetes bacterium]|nr:sulfatase-like hydrolase/transferase [Planctomycetota bacterium]
MKGCAATSTAAILGSGLAPRKIFAGNNGKKPNIVLYVSDDHGLDALGCYGNPIIKTPNMDSLAAEGVRFTNAFCTSASCSASRSVILSGMYNHANGQYGHQHGYHHFVSFDKVKSLPVLLSEAGYRTARAGKLHV